MNQPPKAFKLFKDLLEMIEVNCGFSLSLSINKLESPNGKFPIISV